MIASHNSWTFLPTIKWWMKLISPFCTCQTLNIQEQYNLGIKFFDLRLVYENHKYYIAHNKAKYSIVGLNDDLKFLDNKGGCIIRVSLDCRKEKDCTNLQITKFREYCKYLELIYRNISFVDGRCIGTGLSIYCFNHLTPCFVDGYSSKQGKGIFRYIPWLYAKYKAKKHYKYIHETCCYVMLDFINKDIC